MPQVYEWSQSQLSSAVFSFIKLGYCPSCCSLVSRYLTIYKTHLFTANSSVHLSRSCNMHPAIPATPFSHHSSICPFITPSSVHRSIHHIHYICEAPTLLPTSLYLVLPPAFHVVSGGNRSSWSFWAKVQDS